MTTQVLSVNKDATTQSTAIPSTKVRVVSTDAVYYSVGSNPTANTANCEIIPADTVRYINMEGLNNKISVYGTVNNTNVSVTACGTVFAVGTATNLTYTGY